MNGKIALRTCWECNTAHEHLKKAKGLFQCFGCDRFFENGKFLNNRRDEMLKQAKFVKHNKQGNAIYDIDGKNYTVNDNDFVIDNYKDGWAMYAIAVSDDGLRADLRVIPHPNEIAGVDSGLMELGCINFDTAEVLDVQYAN